MLGKVMVSRDDVAGRAGVSGATVSYVLNNTPGASVSERTRRAVLKAAAELGYRPSLAARALRTGRVNQIGIIVPQGDTLFSAYHESLLRAAWRVASRHGYRLVLETVHGDSGIPFVAEQAVDAVIALALRPADFSPDSRRVAVKHGLPVVMIGGGSWAQEFHTLDIDNPALGRAAADYLAQQGHRRMLLFGGNEAGVVDHKRREGFRQRLNDLGLAPPAHTVDTRSAEPDAGYEAARKLLSQPLDFTAAFCHNDNVAAGLMRAAWDLGLRIPDDLSVIGVDASPIGQFAHCRLTSFRQPLDQMGEEAVRLLLNPPKRPVHKYFPFELVEGHSVRSVRQ